MFLRLWPLLLLLAASSVCQVKKVPNEYVDLAACYSEAKGERQVIINYLRDLKSSVDSLSGIARAMDVRVKNIEILAADSVNKATRKIDSVERQLKELSSKVTEQAQRSRHHEQVVSTTLLNLDREIKSTSSLVRGLDLRMTEIRDQVRTLIKESREEWTSRSRVQEGIIYQVQTVQTVVNSTYTYMFNKADVVGVVEQRSVSKEMLLKYPKATFFRGDNMMGEPVQYDFTTSTIPGGCQDVDPGVQSMKISEFCVRAFKDRNCHGMSSSLYPRAYSGNYVNLLTPELPSVLSVGPCLPTEFQYANVNSNGTSISVTKEENNVRQVPDYVDLTGEAIYTSKSTQLLSATNPVRSYYMDQRRLKWIVALVERNTLNINADNIIGRNLAIPAGLGGPTNETYNTFPQSRKNFEEWKQITSQFRSRLQHSGDWVSIFLTFAYESSSVTKPYGFYYHIHHHCTEKASLLYGFIEN